MNNKTILLVFVLFLLVSCSQKTYYDEVDNDGTMAGDEHSESDNNHDEGELSGETVVVELVARSWNFEPSEIRVNLGDNVELHIKSVDVTHGFMLSQFGVNEMLEPGQEVNVNFIANKTGTFTFFCNVPCGAGHGSMRGQLIVE